MKLSPNYFVSLFKESAFVRVKPERRGVSYPTSSSQLAAATSSVRRAPMSDESSNKRLPRRTAAPPATQQVVRPTPIGYVLLFVHYFTLKYLVHYLLSLPSLSSSSSSKIL